MSHQFYDPCKLLKRIRQLLLFGSAVVVLSACGGPSVYTDSTTADERSFGESECLEAGSTVLVKSPDESLVITGAHWRPDNYEVVTGRNGETTSVSAHCEIEGYYGAYEGRVGGDYRTAIRVRLPQHWNGRFFFQGGAGKNGYVGTAIGSTGAANMPALDRGYAVLAQDSGHDNERNNDPRYQGDLVFGFDPRARSNYGHASLKPSYDIGIAVITAYYGSEPEYRLFSGCSKGGQEGMAFAQRYPDSFDGILAIAPGMSLPRAAVAEAWDTRAFADILEARGEVVTLDSLATALSPAEMAIVQSTVLETCDADDGVEDGIVGAIGDCTSQRVVPALRQRACSAGNVTECIDPFVIDALELSANGPRDSSGNPLYTEFPWDAGIGTPGWLIWKIGIPGASPSFNVVLGAAALAAVLSTPPIELGPDPGAWLAWQLDYDFDVDAASIYAIEPPYSTSPWQDLGMRSTDLSEFRANGGKLIVPHGMSDPVFSAYDSIHWFDEVDRETEGRADDFVRVFPIPGMAHCAGGPATDQYDALTALEEWAIHDNPPDEIMATAGDSTPWPGRKRPLCPHPHRAVPIDEDQGPDGTFVCR